MTTHANVHANVHTCKSPKLPTYSLPESATDDDYDNLACIAEAIETWLYDLKFQHTESDGEQLGIHIAAEGLDEFINLSISLGSRGITFYPEHYYPKHSYLGNNQPRIEVYMPFPESL